MSFNATSKREWVQMALKAPYLTKEDEHALAVAWHERKDPAALDQLIRAHMRLVLAVAARFKRFGLNEQDMIQEGYIGVMEAANRFEPSRDNRFSTYATWWIRASIQDYVLKNWSIVRGGTSSAQKALFFNVRRLRAQLEQGEDALPADEIQAELSRKIGVSVADVTNMEARLSQSDYSLNAPISSADGAESEWGDLLASDAPGPDDLAEALVDQERRTRWLEQAFTELNEREMAVLKARKLSDEAQTLDVVGNRLGISKERVRQIETRAMEKLKAALLRIQPAGKKAYV